MENNNQEVQKEEEYDALMERNGKLFAGMHVTVDLYDAERLDDKGFMESVMREITEKCGAHLLHIHLHQFKPTGVTGVAILSESHISVHTWPERNFAAFDVFMCGIATPELAIDILKERFNAGRVVSNCLQRGDSLGLSVSKDS
jgi:S-adenosylmethionine decarboxylase